MGYCSISSGILLGCSDLRRVGGLKSTIYVGNIYDLQYQFDPVGIGQNFVQSIPFNTYKSLYRIQGPKYAHSASVKGVVGDSGAVAFEHEVTLRVFNDSPLSDSTLQDLTVAELFFIVQTNNQEYLCYGLGDGMRCTSFSAPTGKKVSDDPIATMSFTGTERTMPKRFLVNGDLNQTLNYLSSVSN